MLPPETDQMLVETEHGSVRFSLLPSVVETGSLKSRLRLRIGNLLRPLESGKFASTPFSDVLDQLRVAVADEIQERRRLRVFLTHEQQRRQRRQEHNACRQLQRLGTNQRRKPLTERAVANLIVVLDADNETGTVEPAG